MREIGFRAFIKPLGRYATGLDTIQFHKCCDVAGAGIWTVVTVNEGIFEGDDIIVEQYTGLKDKNGEEICDGDIVRYTIWLNGAAKKLICTKVVKWWSGEEEEWPCCTTSGFSLPHSEDGHEVIGNIHENLELIGKDKQ